MATGIAIVAVSSILAGFSGSFAELIILRGVGGLGSAMFGVSAQTLLLRQRAQRAARPGQRPVRGRVPARRDQRPGDRRADRRLVDAGAVHHLRRHAAHPGRHRRRRAARQVRAARTRRQPPASARISPRSPRALRNRAYRAAASANLADGFAVIGVRAAIVPLFVRDVLQRSAIWTGIGFGVVAVAQRRHPAARRAAGRPARPAAGHRGRLPGVGGGHGHARAAARGWAGIWPRWPSSASVPGCWTSRRRR